MQYNTTVQITIMRGKASSNGPPISIPIQSLANHWYRESFIGMRMHVYGTYPSVHK